jgi:hypothetical protein
MKIQQLSIFVENKPGHLAAPIRLLAEAGVDLRALFLADAREYGVLRMIVSGCERAAALLTEQGFVARVTEVLAIEVSDHPGGLAGVLAALDATGIDIDYMYAFPCRDAERAVLLFSFADPEAAIEKLQTAGINPLASDELFSL